MAEAEVHPHLHPHPEEAVLRILRNHQNSRNSISTSTSISINTSIRPRLPRHRKQKQYRQKQQQNNITKAGCKNPAYNLTMKHNTALTDFFDENSRKLFGYLYKMTGSREDAEDIFQDTFIKYARVYPHQKSPALLFTVAKSLFLDSVRRHRESSVNETIETGGGLTPEEMLIEKQTQKRLISLLDRLTPEEREIISLSGQDGLKYEEIAAITGNSTANIKIKIHRARLKLKKMMEAENE